MKKRKTSSIIFLYLVIGSFGCASIDSESVRPKVGAPLHVSVDQPVVPLDSSYPYFLVAINRVELSSGRSLVTKNRVNDLSDTNTRKENSNTRDHSHDTTNRALSRQTEDTWTKLEGEQKKAEYTGEATSLPEHSTMSGERRVGVKIDDHSVLNEKNRSEVIRDQERESNFKRVDTRKTHEADSQVRESTYFHLAPETDKIRAQLTSALMGIKNIRVVSKSDSFGRLDITGIQAREGEKGPYLMQAMITEFDTLVDAHESETELLVYNSRSADRTFVVGLDIQVVDAKTNRLVTAFPVQGTFRESQLKRGGGLLLQGSSSDMKRSGFDQALRVALNEAAIKTFDALKEQS